MLIGFGVYLGSHLVARYAEQGLAHTLGVTTMRHGTNPLSWLSIHLIGFRCSMGGSVVGGDKGAALIEKNKNRIYLAKDAEDYPLINNNGDWVQKIVFHPSSSMRLLPRLYAILGTTNLVLAMLRLPAVGVCILNKEEQLAPACWQKVAVCAIAILVLPIGFLVPTIKVRIDPEEMRLFQVDLAAGEACFTENDIYPDQIGLVGTLRNGLTLQWIDRIRKHPYRLATGVSMLAISIIVGYGAYCTMTTLLVVHRIAMIAGIVTAVV